MEIRKAERKKSKLRLGLAGPSGSGKTYSALQLAFGIGSKVGMIDTENGSGDLYAHLGDYDIITLQAPYAVHKYLEAIEAFEEGGYDVIIIDSLSHAWSGEGGLLDKQGRIADRTGNSYTAWRTVTPDHNALVEAMLQSRCHIIATVRSKQEYVMDKDEKTGKTSIKKVGMAPVQREGMEYEFTVFLDIAMDHTASASKDRTRLFDGQIVKMDKKTGKKLFTWLNEGIEVQETPREKIAIMAKINQLYPKLVNGQIVEKIKEITKLDPVEENFAEILTRLDRVIEERKMLEASTEKIMSDKVAAAAAK